MAHAQQDFRSEAPPADSEIMMVYLLQPKQYKWIRAAGVHAELYRKQIDGVALQQSDLPAETVLRGRVRLPDICSAGDAFCFVSDQAKAILEELVPGCVQFLPLKLDIPDGLRGGRDFFFIDVLSRAQLIDWDQSVTAPRIRRAEDGRESRTLAGLFTDKATKFKAETADTPPIWREVNVDRPNVQFFVDKQLVFLRDDVWGALNNQFPGQLLPERFG